MSFSPKWAEPQHAVYLLGTICVGFGVAHLAGEGTGTGAILETLIIWSISAFVLFTGYQLPYRRISTPGQWRTVGLAAGVMTSFALLAASIWMIWRLEGNATELSFLLSFAATLGAGVGVRGGLYAIESRERVAEAEDLTKLLTINQRVLRHNLRNELAVCFGFLEEMNGPEHTEETREHVRMIEKHLRRLLRTSDRTREIVSIRESEQEEPFDLAAVVAEQVAQIRETYPSAQVTVNADVDVTVRAHAALPRAIREALTNAIEHNAEGVEVTVTVDETADGSGLVEIADTGEGIPKFDVEAIEGTEETPLRHTQGLGLWIIYWAVEMSGGTLELLESTPRGTVVRITLPRAG